MRLLRLAVLTLATLLVAQLAPAAHAADTAEAEAVAVIDKQGDNFVNITLFCRGNASAGATATTVHCEVWDSGASYQHFRLYPGSSGVCYFKANQMVLPIKFCARVDAQFVSGGRAGDEDCHVNGAVAPPQPPPTSTRTIAECIEPVPLI